MDVEELPFSRSDEHLGASNTPHTSQPIGGFRRSCAKAATTSSTYGPVSATDYVGATMNDQTSALGVY
jgi:hypothetical protein